MTLVGSRPVSQRALERLVSEYGAHLDIETLMSAYGRPLTRWLPANVDGVLFRTLQAQDIAHAMPLPGAHAAVAAVREADALTVVVTSAPIAIATGMLQSTGLCVDTVRAGVWAEDKAKPIREEKCLGVRRRPPRRHARCAAGRSNRHRRKQWHQPTARSSHRTRRSHRLPHLAGGSKQTDFLIIERQSGPQPLPRRDWERGTPLRSIRNALAPMIETRGFVAKHRPGLCREGFLKAPARPQASRLIRCVPRSCAITASLSPGRWRLFRLAPRRPSSRS